jgi:AcrR family transcriptional regulator
MRVKTDARRTAIVRAAWEVFRARGFQGATMSEISDRVGGSKATLYGYFKSKEELFAAALEEAVGERADEMFERLAGPGDLRARLLDYARAYMESRLEADFIGVARALIAEAERSDICDLIRAQFIVPKWRRLASVIEAEMAAGRLRVADPYRAAMHLRGLIEGDLLERRLHGDATITPAEVETEVIEGVDAFLRAYAP